MATITGVHGRGKYCVFVNVDLHVAKRVGELTFSISNNNSCNALLSPGILSTLRVTPVGVSILLGEDLTLQRDQVTRLAIAAQCTYCGLDLWETLFVDFILIDNGIEVRSLVVPVLDCLVIGDLYAVHLQLEVVPARNLEIGS